jgi:hypothetical protein
MGRLLIDTVVNGDMRSFALNNAQNGKGVTLVITLNCNVCAETGFQTIFGKRLLDADRVRWDVSVAQEKLYDLLANGFFGGDRDETLAYRIKIVRLSISKVCLWKRHPVEYRGNIPNSHNELLSLFQQT